MTTTTTTMTIVEIWTAAGMWGEPQEPASRGKWVSWDQQGSRGVMAIRVQRLKDAGLTAYFSAGDRRWGVLAEQVTE